MTETHTDCRTPEGETVALVDAVIALARTLARRHDLATPAVLEALADLRADEDVARLLDSTHSRLTPCSPPAFPRPPSSSDARPA